MARLILESYTRSGWVWGEVVLVLAQFGAMSGFAGTTDYWFGIMGVGLGAQSILGTILLLRRSLGARACIPLARLTQRAPLIHGIIIASSVLRVLLFALYLLIVWLTRKLTNPTVSGLVIGGVGLLVGLVVLVALTVALFPPIATRIHRIIFLAWLVAALASFSYAGPLANIVALIHLPLLPLAATLTLGSTVGPGWASVSALTVNIAYIGCLVALADAAFARRDLLDL